MKRRNKLLALSLVIGLNVQSMQVYANSGSHKITSHRIRKLKKRVMPYTLHKNRHPADMIISTDETAFQSGIASWYGGRHTQRRKTASGSTFKLILPFLWEAKCWLNQKIQGTQSSSPLTIVALS